MTTNRENLDIYKNITYKIQNHTINFNENKANNHEEKTSVSTNEKDHNELIAKTIKNEMIKGIFEDHKNLMGEPIAANKTKILDALKNLVFQISKLNRHAIADDALIAYIVNELLDQAQKETKQITQKYNQMKEQFNDIKTAFNNFITILSDDNYIRGIFTENKDKLEEHKKNLITALLSNIYIINIDIKGQSGTTIIDADKLSKELFTKINMGDLNITNVKKITGTIEFKDNPIDQLPAYLELMTYENPEREKLKAFVETYKKFSHNTINILLSANAYYDDDYGLSFNINLLNIETEHTDIRNLLNMKNKLNTDINITIDIPSIDCPDFSRNRDKDDQKWKKGLKEYIQEQEKIKNPMDNNNNSNNSNNGNSAALQNTQNSVHNNNINEKEEEEEIIINDNMQQNENLSQEQQKKQDYLHLKYQNNNPYPNYYNLYHSLTLNFHIEDISKIGLFKTIFPKIGHVYIEELNINNNGKNIAYKQPLRFMEEKIKTKEQAQAILRHNDLLNLCSLLTDNKQDDNNKTSWMIIILVITGNIFAILALATILIMNPEHEQRSSIITSSINTEEEAGAEGNGAEDENEDENENENE